MPHNLLPALIISICAYLLGSIPFGLILTKLSGQGDIRTIGSGNIGATNVLRTGNKKIAALTLLLDALKGAVIIWLVKAFYITNQDFFAAIAAISAVLGHCFPIWLKFKGGKGVATGIGTFWALSWPVGLCCTIIWLAGIKFTRISSLSALLAFLAAPLIAPALAVTPVASPTALAIDIISLISWMRHYSNITRLIQRKEPKIQKPHHKEP